MNSTAQKVFTILLVEDNGGDVEMFLRTVEEELPREESGKIFKRRLRAPYWEKAGRRI